MGCPSILGGSRDNPDWLCNLCLHHQQNRGHGVCGDGFFEHLGLDAISSLKPEISSGMVDGACKCTFIHFSGFPKGLDHSSSRRLNRHDLLAFVRQNSSCVVSDADLEFFGAYAATANDGIATTRTRVASLAFRAYSGESHKDEFIASVGHELRTPMNAILGLNGVLRDQIKDDAVDLRRVEMIRKSTSHLLAVVNDILDFSQLQADRMVLSLQTMALKQHAHAQFERLNQGANLNQIDCQLVIDEELPDWVSLDPKRFSQTIDNLIENALKFTNEGRIILRFLSISHGLRVEVQDTGIGMTDEQMAQAFGRFEKSSSPAFKIYGGTGLGLSICEKLVRLQGGRIGVESQYNKGALFWFEIPLTPVAEPPTTLSADEVARSTHVPTHFLIVDDHPVNLMVAQQMVKRTWPLAKISTCQSGPLALQFIDNNDVDMILLDMFMPDMDGLAVARAIRERPSPRNQVTILGLTASSNATDHALCTQAGMDGLIFKPLEQDQLSSGVVHAIQSSWKKR